MVRLIMAAFIFSGCIFFPSIMCEFWVVLYFPLTIRESRWLLILARHSLDVQILIFVGLFDFEVMLLFFLFVLDYQSLFFHIVIVVSMIVTEQLNYQHFDNINNGFSYCSRCPEIFYSFCWLMVVSRLFLLEHYYYYWLH